VKHLFIVNPASSGARERVDMITGGIVSFFEGYPRLSYEIHVTRWRRDAVGFVRRFVLGSREFVRVYAMGGAGTLFEVINGIVGLPNVQVAFYPLGTGNQLARCFGEDSFRLFMSIRNLVFSGVVPMDVIRCGHNYGIAFGAIGVLAAANRPGGALVGRVGLPAGLCCLMDIVRGSMKRGAARSYRISLDGRTLDGDYLCALAANQPYCGAALRPGVDALPNDGLLDLYLMRRPHPIKLPAMIRDCMNGYWRKWPEYISHYAGTLLSISSNDAMDVCVDGEVFCDTSVEYEVLPYAVDFVCPAGTNAGAPSRETA
jgi:diacylglycerol kinase family enzyme